ncbi:MAG: GNAT family N-acetyltransferase [Pisciglobus halotolerans]|nr:GNAT family N-acetyltransferase [Pisciglobus halotolerans]
METLELSLPNIEDKEIIMSYREEFIRNGESDIPGSGRLGNFESFENRYAAIQKNSKKETVEEGIIPTTVFLVKRIEDNQLVGMMDIRHYLNDYLLNRGGHIGASIRNSERRKGYSTKTLQLALNECKKIGIDKVRIGCYKSNTGSVKSILQNGGVLDDEVDEGNSNIVQRYWITVA